MLLQKLEMANTNISEIKDLMANILMFTLNLKLYSPCLLLWFQNIYFHNFTIMNFLIKTSQLPVSRVSVFKIFLCVLWRY